MGPSVMDELVDFTTAKMVFAWFHNEISRCEKEWRLGEYSGPTLKYGAGPDYSDLYDQTLAALTNLTVR
jgi:hypothetical protein